MLDTWPNVELPTEVLGGAHWVRLNKLKNSARKAIPSLSSGPNLGRLKSAKSQLFTPEERKVGSVRPSFPYVKSAGDVKHAVLNHWFNFTAPAGEDFLQPGV